MTYLNALSVGLDYAGLTDAAKNQNNCLKNNTNNHGGYARRCTGKHTDADTHSLAGGGTTKRSAVVRSLVALSLQVTEAWGFHLITVLSRSQFTPAWKLPKEWMTALKSIYPLSFFFPHFKLEILNNLIHFFSQHIFGFGQGEAGGISSLLSLTYHQSSEFVISLYISQHLHCDVNK